MLNPTSRYACRRASTPREAGDTRRSRTLYGDRTVRRRHSISRRRTTATSCCRRAREPGRQPHRARGQTSASSPTRSCPRSSSHGARDLHALQGARRCRAGSSSSIAARAAMPRPSIRRWSASRPEPRRRRVRDSTRGRQVQGQADQHHRQRRHSLGRAKLQGNRWPPRKSTLVSLPVVGHQSYDPGSSCLRSAEAAPILPDRRAMPISASSSAVAELTPDKKELRHHLCGRRKEIATNSATSASTSDIRDLKPDASSRACISWSSPRRTTGTTPRPVRGHGRFELSRDRGPCSAMRSPTSIPDFKRDGDKLTMSVSNFHIVKQTPRTSMSSAIDINGNTLTQDKVVRRENPARRKATRSTASSSSARARPDPLARLFPGQARDRPEHCGLRARQASCSRPTSRKSRPAQLQVSAGYSSLETVHRQG